MVSDGELTEINSANLEERTEIHENQKLTIIKVNLIILFELNVYYSTLLNYS
jgi:hypothetical protein